MDRTGCPRHPALTAPASASIAEAWRSPTGVITALAFSEKLRGATVAWTVAMTLSAGHGFQTAATVTDDRWLTACWLYSGHRAADALARLGQHQIAVTAVLVRFETQHCDTFLARRPHDSFQGFDRSWPAEKFLVAAPGLFPLVSSPPKPDRFVLGSPSCRRCS
jgi:hypothetical protein